MDVERSSTLSRPYSTCCLVSMNMQQHIVNSITIILANLLFAQQSAGLKCCVGKLRQHLGFFLLLVEDGHKVPGLTLVQRDPLVIQLLLLHCHQVAAPVQPKLNHILQQLSVFLFWAESHMGPQVDSFREIKTEDTVGRDEEDEHNRGRIHCLISSLSWFSQSYLITDKDFHGIVHINSIEEAFS